MKSFNQFIAAVCILTGIIFAATNLYLYAGWEDSNGRMYRVEISRLADEIGRKGYEAVSLSGCQYVQNIERCELHIDSTEPVRQSDGSISYNNVDKCYGMPTRDTSENTVSEFFRVSNLDSCVRLMDHTLYRFDYTSQTADIRSSFRGIVNLALAAVSLQLFFVLFYIRRKIIRPFELLQEVPSELAKGRPVIPMPQQKNRYFGRFVWGMDLLRESIEQQKKREFSLQYTQKTMVLSISHDIKTPLSAIKLYAKVISKNMYEDTAQLDEIAHSIDEKADEIGEFVHQMIKASGEDFLHLEVANDQFYLSQLMEKTAAYYKDKLRLLHTRFVQNHIPDCLLEGDFDRSVEVLHNLMENAVKYGDGKTIALSCSQEEGYVLITVKNSGNTLPETELVHIFDSFWRGSNAGNSAGSGLGLYICRQLMQRMGGDVFAQVKEGQMCVTAVFRT